MVETAEFLLAIGGFLLLGLATDFLGRHTFLPRVTLLLILGIILGDDVLALIPETVSGSFEIVADLALLMIGFILGGRLTLKRLMKSGKQLVWISISAALGTAMVVGWSLVFIGMPLDIAILLGCIAAATAPAATTDTVLESGQKTQFSRLLLAIVAIDDAWALLLFSIGIAGVSILNGSQEFSSPLLHAIYEIGGAILLGGVIGLPASYLTGRIRPGQPMMTEALGLVLLCGGAAIWLNVSFLISSMVMGAVIANMARHHTRPFHEIENIEWPFMVIFFMLAGALLDIDILAELGIVGSVYIISRVTGKLAGAWAGARISDASEDIRRWMGLALLPQAGVAIGMALIAANRFPEYQQLILSVVVSTTVLFELFGPVFTRMALKRTGSS